MYISDKAWDKYIALLRRVNEKAAQEMFEYLATHNWWTSRKEKQAAMDYAFALATKYGEAAGAAVCEFYDQVADEWAGKATAPAVPAKTATYGEVAKAFNGTAKTLNTKMMSDAIGRLVKMAGVDTMMQNALRDGAEWAWIPRGDTCVFCLTLASRGWQEASLKAVKNGHAEHVHANCDCTYAVRFGPDQDVEGYHPEEYQELYYSAEGDSPQEKINSMRRMKYALDKDKINAQKRAAYARKTHREIQLMSKNYGISHDLPEKMRKKLEEGPRPGKLISEEEIRSFSDEVEKRGYRFANKIRGLSRTAHGGFEYYRGSIDELYSILEELDNTREYWTDTMKRKGVLIGYEDFGNLDDFARTNGRNVFFNKKIYDDSEYLEADYMDGVLRRIFSKGTDHRMVSRHEIGHVIQNTGGDVNRRTERVIRHLADQEGVSFKEKALQLTSLYGITNTEGEFKELICEVLAASGSNEKETREEALMVLKEVFAR